MAGLAKSPYGTKPADLSSSVPSPAAGADPFSDLPHMDEVATSAQAPAPTPTPAPAAQGAQSADPFADLPAAGAPQKGVLGQVLDGAKRVLDYPGGLVRTGDAAITSLFGGENTSGSAKPVNALISKFDTSKEVVTMNDFKEALKGNAPSSADYLARMGLPELGSVNIPLLGKITGRGVVGFATDVAADPLTSISNLIKEGGAAGKVIASVVNAPGAGAEALGESVYRSALKKVDAKVAQKTGEAGTPVADALLQQGAPVGGTEKLAQKVQDMSATMGKLRQGLYDEATKAGVKVTPDAFPQAQAVLDRLRRDPNLTPLADTLGEMVDKYKSAGPQDLAQVSEWKTNLYNALPDSAFNGVGKLKAIPAQFKAALAGDFKNMIIDTGNDARKGLGDAINTVNDRWGPIIAAQDPLAKQVARDAGASGLMGSQIDHAILSFEGLSKYAIKKGLDIATTTTGRTVLGKALMQAGQKGVANRLFINSQQAAPAAPADPFSGIGQ